MSVVPQPWPQPVAQLAEAVAAMYRGKRERPLPVLVRDELGGWLSDEQFASVPGAGAAHSLGRAEDLYCPYRWPDPSRLRLGRGAQT